MALEKQKVAIPFTAGLNDKISKIVKSNSILDELENVELKTKGEISKRPGSEVVVTTSDDVTKIVSYNNELIDIRDNQLFSVNTTDGSNVFLDYIRNDFTAEKKFQINSQNLSSVRNAILDDVISTVYISVGDIGTDSNSDVIGFQCNYNTTNERFTQYNESFSVPSNSVPRRVDIIADDSNFFVAMIREDAIDSDDYLTVFKRTSSGATSTSVLERATVNAAKESPLEMVQDATHFYCVTGSSSSSPSEVKISKIAKSDLSLTATIIIQDPEGDSRPVQSLCIEIEGSQLYIFVSRQFTGISTPWVLSSSKVPTSLGSQSSQVLKNIGSGLVTDNMTCDLVAAGVIMVAWDAVDNALFGQDQVEVGNYATSNDTFKEETSDSAGKRQLRGPFKIAGDMTSFSKGGFDVTVILPLRHWDIRTNVSQSLILFRLDPSFVTGGLKVRAIGRQSLGIAGNHTDDTGLLLRNNRFSFSAAGTSVLERQYVKAFLPLYAGDDLPYFRNAIVHYSYSKSVPQFVIFKELLFFTGNFLHMYDGTFLTEHNFLYEPKIIGTIAYKSISGSFSDGIVLVKIVYQYTNTKGDIIESQPSITYVLEFTNGGSSQHADLGTIIQYRGGYRTERESFDTDLVSTVVYRTELNGTIFHRTNELTTDINGNDEDTLIQNATLYTEGGVDGNIAIASCEYVAVFDGRLAVMGGEFDGRVVYSKPDSFDFYELDISVSIPQGAFRANGLIALDSRLLVFKRDKVFQIFGNGADNTGAGNYQPAIELPFEQGLLDKESLVLSTLGVLYKSLEGIYLIDRGLQNSYIGANVELFNNLTVNCALSVDSSNEILFFTDTFTLVYDYENGLWSTNTGQNAKTCTNHLSVLNYCAGGGANIVRKDTSFTEESTSYTMRFKTAWIKISGITGFQRMWKGTLQGVFEGNHTVQLKIYYDYQDAVAETLSFTVTSGDMEIEFLPGMQRCKSIALEYTFTGDNQNCRVNAIEFLIGVKNNKHRISKDRRMV